MEDYIYECPILNYKDDIMGFPLPFIVISGYRVKYCNRIYYTNIIIVGYKGGGWVYFISLLGLFTLCALKVGWGVI